MPAIWHSDGTGWSLVPPAELPDEATLHRLVEEAPQILPLAGRPSIAVVGREVQLGAGLADLVGVEPGGRVVIIEVKLARNAEARRAVVSQVLAYAAYLKGTSPQAFEEDILGSHMTSRGYDSLANAVSAFDQEGEYDPGAFAEGLAESLKEGRFRLVLVLDAAPPELVRLVGYLESIGEKLLIDLVTVSSYEVGGSRILVPQRVDPERQIEEESERPRRFRAQGELVAGADDFVQGIGGRPAEQQPAFRMLADWALSLEKEGLAELSTYHTVDGRLTLLPRILPEKVGLVTIVDDAGPAIQLWRTVFTRLAPATLPLVEERVAPATVGKGNFVRQFDTRMLEALTLAYREAAGKRATEGRGTEDT